MIKVEFDINEKKYVKANWLIFFKQQQTTMIVAFSVVIIAAIVLAACFQNFIGVYILAALLGLYAIICVALQFSILRAYRTNQILQKVSHTILELDEEKIVDITVNTDGSEQSQTFSFDDIYKVLITKKCILIFISSINFYFIMDEKYLEGDRETFKQYLFNHLPAMKFKFNKKK